MNTALLLHRAATDAPERTAVYLGTRPLHSYRELRDRVAALSAAMTGLGCAPGERVAVVMNNRPEYLEVLYAAWWAGLAVVPVNSKLHPAEVAWIVQDAGARLVVTDEEHLEEVSGAAPGKPLLVADGAEYDALVGSGGTVLPPWPTTATDLAWLFYTSGTTGRPKGVMLGHRQLLALALSYHAQIDRVGPDDRTLYAAPMSHGAGLYSPVFTLRGSAHVFPPSGRFDAAETCHIARVLGRVSLFAAPTMVNRLVRHVTETGTPVEDTTAFRTIVYGGGPMYADDLVRARDVMGDCLTQIYGQGESPMTITTLGRDVIADEGHPRRQHRIASVGTAFALCDVKVVDTDGAPLPPGTTGEIVVRGDTVMLGYWHDPEATAAAVRDGWLWTGDMGSLDEDGYLTLKDRSKDVIISGGTNIYPREVEEVLLQHPDVTEVSVIGSADPEWGETVVACVVADGSVDAHQLDRFCRQRMTAFKRPRRYHFLDTLPKSDNGKILKSVLRTMHSRPSPAPATAARRPSAQPPEEPS
ncbi:class I adenylate-forming enzyme family protein [Streptomyces sp. GC420]|uniref:class I adenylate-forming enzyme family protein n=1 Tax=Streptomyces sp. GC420 TaxID=2697568 RepID=UPI0014151DFB|nr:AMP-binding protein [Streptomyces sp. GC420]NBM14447.1 AMP-binding protein [Streptomyces sp. GC420]